MSDLPSTVETEEIKPIGPRIREEVLNGVEHPLKRRFLIAFAESGITRQGCEAARVSRAAVSLWRQKDEQFALLFIDAQEDAYDQLEAHAWRRATDTKKPSDILTIFLLKAARPTKFRDNISISGHDGGPLFRMVAGVSPQRVCGVEPELRLGKAKAKALLESDAVKQPAGAVETVKS